MTKKARTWKLLGVLALAALSLGCATTPGVSRAPEGGAPPKSTPQAQKSPAGVPSPSTKARTAAKKRPSSISAEALGIYRTPDEMQAPPSDDELAVVASAKTLVGKAPESTVIVNGKEFVLDCIGTVAAVFYGVYIDVTKDFARYAGTGVDRLFKSLSKQHVLHTDKYPRPGDVVIWDNTWDANGNGDRNDDPRTHAGVVLAVDEDGTIHYIHENYRRGVIIEVMNLLRPATYQDAKGHVLNSPMAMAPKPGEKRSVHWVSGDLFDAFGDVLGAKQHYRVAAADVEGSADSSVALRTQ